MRTLTESARVVRTPPAARAAWADNLKITLVAGVIVAHTTMAWTGFGTWVFDEEPVREPLLTLLVIVTAVLAIFGMPLFFFVAGYFTPASFERKGFARFVARRALRLLVPMAAFVLLLSPPIEFVDPDNAGWTGDFWSFAPTVWWPPVPGPTWFLGVLFVFSVGYATLRALRPARLVPASPRWWQLLVGGLAVAACSFPITVLAPLGQEVWHLAIAQAPAWLAGFVLGALAAENHWLPLEPGMARRVRWTAWVSMAVVVGVIVYAGTSDAGMDPFLGGGTWQSALFVVIEGLVVVMASLWLVDVFEQRADHQGSLGRAMGRAAFGAFLVHQGVLVALVSAAGVALSFGIGWLLTRIPGVRQIV